MRRFALALVLAAMWPAPAEACGGFFCMRSPMDQAGERILFIQDGWDVTAHVQVKYQGDAKKFSWVVPTPTEPKIGVGSETLFTKLDEATRPQWQLDIKDLGGCEHPRWEAEDRVYPSAPQLEGKVQVVSQAKVGPYDSAVIRSNDPQALKAWLRKNGYEIPPKLDPLLDPYVAGKYYFVALKLQQDRGSGDLQPVTLTYRATKPGVPIRLTAVAATPDMDLYVWHLGGDRAIPENYRHAKINEARVDWLSNGANYRDVVTKAANEAGGQAFVTDYAGKSEVMDLDIMEGKRHDTAKLAKLTNDPVRFLRAIQEDGYFLPGSQNAISFVRRYVPIPKHMKDVWEPGFYSNPEQYALQLKGVKVDAPKAAAELEETVVKPFKAIRKAFSRHPYLTRLYTTMSPEEMTQDPMFRTTAVLPDVSNVHKATGVRDCRKVKEYWRAPITITLKDGTRFTVDPTKSRNFFPESSLPAALVVEQLYPDQPPSVIADHRAEVTAKLAEAPAERPAFPVGPGGAGLAAIALGFLGWRRWRRTP